MRPHPVGVALWLALVCASAILTTYAIITGGVYAEMVVSIAFVGVLITVVSTIGWVETR